MVKSIDSQIRYIETMEEYLASMNKRATFHSKVYHIVLNDDTEHVLKLPEETDKDRLQTIIGEVAAYEISIRIFKDLVPKTQLVTYEGQLCSLQELVKNTGDKEYYQTLLDSNTIEVQYLKLLWFITGQWDTDIDNVLFQNRKPIAIDNANIAHTQKVKAYGQFPFIRTCETAASNKGSIDDPIIYEEFGGEILEKVAEDCNGHLPATLKDELIAKSTKWTRFVYYIEDGFVYRNFYVWQEKPGYFMEKFSMEALKKFAIISDTGIFNIFEVLINKTFETLDEEAVQKVFNINKSEITNYFMRIFQDMQTRYKLAEKYFIEQIQPTLNASSIDEPVLVLESTLEEKSKIKIYDEMEKSNTSSTIIVTEASLNTNSSLTFDEVNLKHIITPLDNNFPDYIVPPLVDANGMVGNLGHISGDLSASTPPLILSNDKLIGIVELSHEPDF